MNRPAPSSSTPRPQGPASPLTDSDIAKLDNLLADLAAPLEPLDASALDGFLTGVILQQPRVEASQWLPFVYDAEGRPLPAGAVSAGAQRQLADLARRRHAELERAVAQRQWFDPWIFELDDEAEVTECVLPWVAGFAIAMDRFPGVMNANAQSTLEPLAVIYSHLDPDDLEDADALLAEIETLEPLRDLAEAVEDLVRCSLLLADVTRPQPRPAAPRRLRQQPPRRPGPRR